MTNYKKTLSHGAGVLPFGKAPDGLPWSLAFDRGFGPSDMLGPIARWLGYDAQEGYEETPLEPVFKHLASLYDQRDVQVIDTGDTSVECYVTQRPIAQVLGPTLLERLFRQVAYAGEITVQPYTPARQDTRTVAPATVATASATPPPEPPVRAAIGSGRLAIPLDGSPALVVRRVERSKQQPVYRFSHFLEPESIRAFPGARCLIRQRPYGEKWEGDFADRDAYIAARKRSVEQYGSEIIGDIQKAGVSEAMTKLARLLQKLHDQGEIHGDIKPANLLSTARGIRAIDSLKLVPGRKSSALTPGWAAPEQIIGEPVTPSTDQYSLGLLLCRLVGGVIHGEEVSYLIPVGGMKLERFTLLRNPGVYIEPDGAALPAEGIGAWQQFLCRCLRFQPENRFDSMTALADEVTGLSSRYPVSGALPLPLQFGDFTEPAGWQVRDR